VILKGSHIVESLKSKNYKEAQPMEDTTNMEVDSTTLHDWVTTRMDETQRMIAKITKESFTFDDNPKTI